MNTYLLKRMRMGFLVLCAFACMATGGGCTNGGTDSLTESEPKSDGDIILTLALTGNPEFQDVVDEFNAADNGYQIVVKRYRENIGADGLPIAYDEEEYHYADMEILQDIINTDTIDIICSVSFSDNSNYDILKNKGAYVDLYPFMEQDEEVNTSTLNQHILSLNETDGKLYSLPTFYGVTTLIGETRYVGSKENWTVDEFISHWEEMPDGSTISGSRQRENIYYTVLRGNLSYFVDYEHAEVHFDSPEFRQLLEFCHRFESNHGQKGEYDYDAPNFVQAFDLDGISYATGLVSGDTQQTLVGYPSFDGKGAFFTNMDLSYSISAKSSPEKQAGAWAFIRTFVTYEYQKSRELMEGQGVISGIPLNNRVFEESGQALMTGKYDDGTAEDKEITYERPALTQEDYDKLVAYLDSIDRWENGFRGALWNIVNEETMAYLADEKSLDEVVGLIQSRASLWISEQS